MIAPPGARVLEYMRFRLLWPSPPNVCANWNGYDFENAFGPFVVHVIVNGETIRTVRLLDLPDIPVQQEENQRGAQLFGLALDYPVSPGDDIKATIEFGGHPFPNVDGFTLVAECSIVGEMILEGQR